MARGYDPLMARLPVPRRGAPRGPLPWKTILAVAMWLIERGRERWDRLSPRDQREVTRLVRQSRGRRGNLTPHEQAELRRIVTRALRPGDR